MPPPTLRGLTPWPAHPPRRSWQLDERPAPTRPYSQRARTPRPPSPQPATSARHTSSPPRCENVTRPPSAAANINPATVTRGAHIAPPYAPADTPPSETTPLNRCIELPNAARSSPPTGGADDGAPLIVPDRPVRKLRNNRTHGARRPARTRRRRPPKERPSTPSTKAVRREPIRPPVDTQSPAMPTHKTTKTTADASDDSRGARRLSARRKITQQVSECLCRTLEAWSMKPRSVNGSGRWRRS